MRIRALLSAGVVLVSQAGCAAKSPAPASAPQPAPAVAARTAPATAAPAAPARGRANLITEAEIAASAANLQNAFEIVQRLRPAMLRTRSGSTTGSNGGAMDVTATEIKVYFDSTPLRGIDGLREIQATQIREIRYLSANDATTLFGTGHQGGAIQVISRR